MKIISLVFNKVGSRFLINSLSFNDVLSWWETEAGFLSGTTAPVEMDPYAVKSQ